MTGWLQSTHAFDDTTVFDTFDQLFMASKAPSGAALFSRDGADLDKTIYLLTPDAARWASALPGEWTACDDYLSHKWIFEIGEASAPQRFGITIGSD